MTQAAISAIQAAVQAYRKLTAEEREVYAVAIACLGEDAPARRRGRPKNKPAEPPLLASQ